MTKEILKEQLDELIKLNGVPYSYFLSWKPNDNHICNEHGAYKELEEKIQKMETAETCIQGELPFETLVVYFNTVCDVFRRDEYWDCIEDPSEFSHNVFGVPYVGMDGNWLYLNGTTETVYLNDNEL